MKILLDENLPHDLRHHLNPHDVYTVAHINWTSILNGALLSLAAANQFDVVVTKDTGVEYEQHFLTLPIAVVIPHARTNKLADLLPLVPAILAALPSLAPRSLIHIR